jgi:polyisoprenoid-binding protein YceI
MQGPSGTLATSSLQAQLADGTLAGEWVLDPGRSSVRLKSKVMGLIRVNGVFREVTGSGSVRPDGAVRGTLTVAAASIDTKNARRDKHLRSADFLDSGSHPDIAFTADGIRPDGQGAAIAGALTVCGRTRPLSVDAAASVRDGGEVALKAAVRINQADFGMTWNPLGLLSRHSILSINATFIRRRA